MIASIHFLRFIFLSFASILIGFTNIFSILLLSFFIPAIFELLLGWFILRKKPLAFVVSIVIIPLIYPSFILWLYYGPPQHIPGATVFFSYLVEVILSFILGLLVLNREWVRDP